MYNYDEEKLQQSFQSVHRLINQTLQKSRNDALPYLIDFMNSHQDTVVYLRDIPIKEETEYYRFQILDYEVGIDLNDELRLVLFLIDVKSEKHRELLRSTLLHNGFIRKVKDGKVWNIWEHFDLLIEVYDIHHIQAGVYTMYFLELTKGLPMKLGFSEPTQPSLRH